MHANQERRGPRLPRHATPHHRNTSVRKLSATVDIDFEIGKLNLTRQQIDDLVAFLGRPLTDQRVVDQRAPFDHPQLFVPNGMSMRGGRPRITDDGVARDLLLEIPAVGRSGGPLPIGFLQ